MKARQLNKKEFSFDLPQELIAQTPIEPRDNSRLFVYDRANQKKEHKNFFNLVDYLKSGDLLIINNTKVMPARLLGKKVGTGGKVEVFLLQKIKGKVWQVLLGGKAGNGLEITLSPKLQAKVLENNQDGTWNVEFNMGAKAFKDEINKVGHMPLPPYIRKGIDTPTDATRYQTVFSRSSKEGSVAAPTAGLHFTKDLLNKLKHKGVEIGEVTLNVGLGTFLPVKADNISEHKMHAEKFEVPVVTINKIIETKKRGGRVIAVGTTAARTLESAAGLMYLNTESTVGGWTSIFIYPPYKFQIVDCLLTNFHLPESTLLMMLAAFLEQGGGNGIKTEQNLYAEAIKEKYRFFSYGDAMLII